MADDKILQKSAQEPRRTNATEGGDERREAAPESEAERVLEDETVPARKKAALLNAVHGVAEH